MINLENKQCNQLENILPEIIPSGEKIGEVQPDNVMDLLRLQADVYEMDLVQCEEKFRPNQTKNIRLNNSTV